MRLADKLVQMAKGLTRQTQTGSPNQVANTRRMGAGTEALRLYAHWPVHSRCAVLHCAVLSSCPAYTTMSGSSRLDMQLGNSHARLGK